MINLSVTPNPPINGQRCIINYNCSNSSNIAYVRIYVDGTMQTEGNRDGRYSPSGTFYLTKSTYNKNVVKFEAYYTNDIMDATNSVTLNGIYPNRAPSAPTYLRISQSNDLTAGQTVTLSWDKGSDPDGDTLTYRLYADYVKVDGSSESTTIYAGQSLSYSYTIPRDKYKSVRYRIDCIDNKSASSGFTYSDNRNIINNSPPTNPSSISVTMS